MAVRSGKAEAEVAGDVFQIGERIAHPVHGVGEVQSIGIEDLGTVRIDCIRVHFPDPRLTLRVPRSKVVANGLRRLASSAVIEAALAVLKTRPKVSKTTWARRTLDLQAKINSGQPEVIAEVVRDLGRNAENPDQSFSERHRFEEALDKLAAEIAAVQNCSKAEAQAQVMSTLLKRSTVGEGDAQPKAA